MLRITSEYNGYETRYPKILELSNKQLEDQIWFASEIKVVEEDRMEMLYDLTEKQKSVVKAILPMFRRIEHDVGKFWVDVYAQYFKAPECQEAAAVVNMIERAVHERFYDKINIVFGLDNDESYLSYLDDPIFKDRAKWLGKVLKDEDKHKVCLIFGLTEGVSLFSLFALLRSFQANGVNKITTTVKGTKASALDELLHSDILATTFVYYYKELGMTLEQDVKYLNILKEETHNVVEMEKFILRALIGDEFNGVTLEEYYSLIEMLANDFFVRLGVSAENLPFPERKSSPLHGWFLDQVVAYAEPDFFAKGMGKEYELAWNEDGFGKVWTSRTLEEK